MSKPRVLFVNSMGPYEPGWGQDMYDLFGARLTRAQGPFTMNATFQALGLHLIAENLGVPSVVLEWPTEKEFRRELSRGYEFVAIQVITIHVPKIARMVRIIRETAPETKIVLGGYGVSTLYDPPPHDPDGCAGYLLSQADHVCREEGVAFMRRLVGTDPDLPITQFHIPRSWSSIAGLSRFSRLPVSSTLVSLGCPNGCEFCNTSAFFRLKKIRVATPEVVVASVKASLKTAPPGPPLFHMLWDEDLLADREFVLSLGELLFREGILSRVRLAGFASMKSISQFTVDEIAGSGIGSLWIGVESKFEEAISGVHRFEKRQGREIGEVFAELRSRGVNVIASNIIGLDFHTPENILEDLDFFVSLKPDMYQVAPLTPCPGTRLYERMKEDGRLYDHYSWEQVHIWSDRIYSHPNLADGEMQRYFDVLHEKLYQTNGPTVLSILDADLSAYENLAHSPDPRLQERAWASFRQARITGVLIPSLYRFSPSAAVTRRVEEVEARWNRLVGPAPRSMRLPRRIVLSAMGRKAREQEALAAGQSLPARPPEFVVTRHPGDGSRPRVVRRGNAVRHALSSAGHFLARAALARQEPEPSIHLADIARFDVTFRTAKVEGLSMNYVDEGTGPVLLMLHGNPTWSFLYRHLIHDLRSDFRCVAPDLIGYGLSDKPPDADYSMEAHARRLAGFIQKLGLSDITLVGQDWGGIIGLACAARHKERFSGLVPMNTTGFLPRSRSGFRALAGARAVPYLWLYKTPWLGKKMAVDWNLFLRFAMTLGIHNRGRQLTEKALAGYLYPFQRPRDRAAILASVRQVPMAPFTAVWRMLWRTEKALSGWDVPARCIWGTRDPVFVPWFVQRFEELLPNHMESLLIPTASHFLQDDEPGIVTRGIREFMAWAENQRKVKAA